MKRRDKTKDERLKGSEYKRKLEEKPIREDGKRKEVVNRSK